jgi:ribosomal protein L11 methylase PrmA
MGAARCVGVDVETEALVASERNVHLNGLFKRLWLHREVVPYALCGGVDVCVANILIEQLCRASMVAAIVSNMVPGATVVSFGHSTEVDSLKAAYADHAEWLDDQYAELSAVETGSIVVRFDCGRWARLVGRKTKGAGRDR